MNELIKGIIMDVSWVREQMQKYLKASWRMGVCVKN